VGPFSVPLPPNVRQPNVARIYDRLLGGKDNFRADRDAAARLQELLPDVARAARENRYFLERVVRYLVGQAGIRQIIDIGTGLPTQDNVHEVAQRIAPDARVVYVDNDPVVVRHGMALLATNENVAMAESDLRTPREIMTHPDTLRLIDFSGPVAVLMLASLHFVTDVENPQATLRLWRETVQSGSYLAISHITADEVEPAKAKAAQEVYADASAPAVPRTLAEVESFFDGFELVPPGVVNINSWPIPVPDYAAEDRALLYGGLGRR
jgi:S-adenosyl methyltransferase